MRKKDDMLVERFSQNPLITPADIVPSRKDYEVIGAFNAGVTTCQGQTILLLRIAERPKERPAGKQLAPILNTATGQIENVIVDNRDPDVYIPDSRVFVYKEQLFLTSISHFRVARSSDGVNFTIASKPSVFPQTEYETFGVEDARITKIDEIFYVTYKAVSPHGIATALLRTNDFTNFQKLGIIFCPENIDVVIFPEKINGRFYALTRPVPKHIGPLSIWLASSENLLDWGGYCVLVKPRSGMFDCQKVGAGCMPIKTPYGWLEIYHGVDENDHYSLAAALLDIKDPSKLLSRSKIPLMQPDATYERTGFYNNVVFSCGAVANSDGTIVIYYGAGDCCTAAARTTVDKILKTLE